MSLEPFTTTFTLNQIDHSNCFIPRNTVLVWGDSVLVWNTSRKTAYLTVAHTKRIDQCFPLEPGGQVTFPLTGTGDMLTGAAYSRSVPLSVRVFGLQPQGE